MGSGNNSEKAHRYCLEPRRKKKYALSFYLVFCFFIGITSVRAE